jgi:hypothetical protein
MLWCALHHHGPQAVHHDIPSRWCPSSSLSAHKVDFVCTLIIHSANGSGTWLHFGCFASPLWQMHPSGLLVELRLSHTHHSKLVFLAQCIEHYIILSGLVSDVHIEQCQCVLPSHLFWWQHMLSGKVLQGHCRNPTLG